MAQLAVPLETSWLFPVDPAVDTTDRRHARPPPSCFACRPSTRASCRASSSSLQAAARLRGVPQLQAAPGPMAACPRQPWCSSHRRATQAHPGCRLALPLSGRGGAGQDGGPAGRVTVSQDAQLPGPHLACCHAQPDAQPIALAVGSLMLRPACVGSAPIPAQPHACPRGRGCSPLCYPVRSRCSAFSVRLPWLMHLFANRREDGSWRAGPKRIGQSRGGRKVARPGAEGRGWPQNWDAAVLVQRGAR